MTHKEQAYEQICRRAELFGKHINSYKAAEKQNETETRVKFIDHFFKSLGWDMDNSKCLPPHLEEVIREETISIEGSETKKDELFARHTQGRTDYTFRDKFGKPLFYLEAKKPSVDILDGDEEALQIRSYSWNTNLPIGVLTDFEELAVYDGTIPTKPNDKAAVARADYFNYKQYADRKTFDYIYDRFAQENVTHGSLREYQQTYNDRYNYRKGTKTVDEAFLESLEQWRTELAQHIVLYNDQEVFSLDEINYFVQITLNRILFLRNCEDRNIEPYKGLFICTEDVKEKNRIYANFLQICERADRRYNSGLFDLTRYNRLVYRMRIGNGTLGNLIRNTYYPVSPYRFELISPDILGTAYERFLGKTIVITNKLNAKGQPLGNTVNGIFIPSKVAAVDYKPEVRKAGGVFYTPQYVVKYIIENTIGKQIQGLTPNEVSALTFCDPACGSGSFLIGVYQYLIDWHTEYYTENVSAAKAQPNRPAPLQGGRLTVAERKRILTNNIYGVDIDAQAVEVTKLSLLMLCLADTASPDPSEGGEITHLLPNIDANIQCGNSLIDTEFDWKRQFKAVFAKGGFDAVVGNPPYVKEYTDRTAFEIVKDGNLSKYYQGKMDLWYFFTCMGLDYLKLNGLLGFIAPNNWTTNAGASVMRNKIVQDATIIEMIDFANFMVFKDASIQTMILILQNNKHKDNYTFTNIKVTEKATPIEDIQKILHHQYTDTMKVLTPTFIRDNYKDKFLVFENDAIEGILDKIKGNENNIFFKEKEVANGIHPHYDFITKVVNEKHDNKFKIGQGIFGLSNDEKQSLQFTKEELQLIKPYFTTLELGIYYGNNKNKLWLIYTDSRFKKTENILPYPNIKKHLDKFINVITSDNKPYGLHRARDERFFTGEKIIALRKCPNRPVFTYTDFDCYASATFYIIKTDRINQKYLTGLLNSKLVAFWLKNRGKMQGNNYQIDKEPILQIPLIQPDKTSEQKIVQLVEKILLQKTTNAPDTSALEAEIDALVYALYGLTSAEIAVVEGA